MGRAVSALVVTLPPFLTKFDDPNLNSACSPPAFSDQIEQRNLDGLVPTRQPSAAFPQYRLGGLHSRRHVTTEWTHDMNLRRGSDAGGELNIRYFDFLELHTVQEYVQQYHSFWKQFDGTVRIDRISDQIHQRRGHPPSRGTPTRWTAAHCWYCSVTLCSGPRAVPARSTNLRDRQNRSQ